jgi:hypothetical protein
LNIASQAKIKNRARRRVVKRRLLTGLEEVRKTVEYAEAMVLIKQKNELSRHRRTIVQQIKVLRGVSNVAVQVAQQDVGLEEQ